MLSQGQTLRNKETNELVRLVPTGDGSPWHWPDGDSSLFYRINGEQFRDKLSNYTHITDELGRPTAGRVKPGEYVDTSLKKYLCSEEQMAVLREERFAKWEAEVLTKLREDGHVHCPFADGSLCIAFKKYFLKKYGARPLHYSYNPITETYDFMYCQQYIMKIGGGHYMYDGHLSRLVPTCIDHIQSVLETI